MEISVIAYFLSGKIKELKKKKSIVLLLCKKWESLVEFFPLNFLHLIKQKLEPISEF